MKISAPPAAFWMMVFIGSGFIVGALIGRPVSVDVPVDEGTQAHCARLSDLVFQDCIARLHSSQTQVCVDVHKTSFDQCFAERLSLP